MSPDRRSLLRAALIGTVLLIPPLRGARAAEVRVTDRAGLDRALAAATGGETIRLAPGHYGALRLHGRKRGAFAATVTLVSADPADPAVFSSAEVRGVANLVIDGLRFDYSFTPGDRIYKQPFLFKGCTDLVIRGSTFDGDLARGVSPEQDGLGYAIGLTVGGATRATIAGNRITRFHRGLAVGGGTDVVVTGNDVSGMRMDAMNFSSMRNVRIEGNHIHGFRRSTLKGDHCDMIQFWTEGAGVQTSGIVIRGNLLQAGDGDPTQSIFMRNELVDTRRAGREMFYRDVTIEENVILNGHLHGISLGEAEGVVIRRNTVLRDPAFADLPDRAHPVYIPRIGVRGASVDVEVRDNIAARMPKPQPEWRIEDNLLVQDISRLEPNHYGQLFAPRPTAAGGGAGGLAALTRLVVRPGSAADRPGLGAPLMR